MSNELQNDEFYLKGDLGSVKIGSAIHPITKVFKGKDGTTTLTVTPFPRSIEITTLDEFPKWKEVTLEEAEQAKIAYEKWKSKNNRE